LDLQGKRALKESWDGLEPRVRMDPTELLDPLELQENKAFLEYLVARERLEILERRAHQGRLVSLGRLVYLVPRAAMVGQELQDRRGLREIRVTQDPTAHRDLLVLMESTVNVALWDQKVKKGSLVARVVQEPEDHLVLKGPRVILGHLASQEHQGSRALEESRESLDSLENMARKATEECKEALGHLVCQASWVLLASLA
jgi:hypothetical protein